MTAVQEAPRCTRLPNVSCQFAGTCGSVALTELLAGTSVRPCVLDMVAAVKPQQPQKGEF
jgi:hypothetical protein